jgi:hypothetical protein
MQNPTLNKPLIALCVALSCAWATGASAMTKEEYKAANDRIGADYKTQKARCDGMKGNAKDVCVSEAKGTEKVAKAELEAQFKPTDKSPSKVMEAKADAAYDIAKEKCDDLAGNTKDVCVKDAKAAHTSALGSAKVSEANTKASNDKTAKIAEARQDATADTRKAEYAAAKERCDALAGNAKDSCVTDAKTKYGM